MGKHSRPEADQQGFPGQNIDFPVEDPNYGFTSTDYIQWDKDSAESPDWPRTKVVYNLWDKSAEQIVHDLEILTSLGIDIDLQFNDGTKVHTFPYPYYPPGVRTPEFGGPLKVNEWHRI